MIQQKCLTPVIGRTYVRLCHLCYRKRNLKKSEEILAKDLKVSHPYPILGVTKKNGQLAKKVKSLGKSPRECPLAEGIDMEPTITINEGAVSTMTDQALAQAVVDARAELARVKELAELAETAFKASGLESVTLDDGTKVAIVEQSRRAIDNAKLKDVLPTGQFQRVTKRVGDLKLIDGGIEANWLDADLVGEAIKTTTVRALKVTQPKR